MAEATAPIPPAAPPASAFVALLIGNVALAFGPWFVRMADTGPVASAFWRIALAAPVLVAAALATGLATAICETAWYALTTGVSAWMVFQANLDVVAYQDLAFLRPGHWVALTGLVVAGLHAWRAPAARQPRGRRAAVSPVADQPSS